MRETTRRKRARPTNDPAENIEQGRIVRAPSVPTDATEAEEEAEEGDDVEAVVGHPDTNEVLLLSVFLRLQATYL